MKIGLISLYLPSGSKIGVGYVVHYFANEMVKRGHEVTVFSQSGSSEGAIYRTVQIDSGARFRTFGFAWNLRKVDFSGFDVINAHGDDWFLMGRKRPRHIHTYHGSCLAEMLNVRGAKEKARMGALALCEYTACFLADVNVGVSRNTQRYIPMIRHVIPNGVNLESFHPAPIEQKAQAPTLLFVGTMHGRKRGAMLLDMFRQVIRPRIPNAEFWAVCENPIEGEGVRWFGRVPTEQLTDLYRRAWVFCLPSTYEGFGVPYIEAMASGTAVVATPNPGSLEVLQNGDFGIVVETHLLAEAITNLMLNADERLRLREAGLERVKEFSWDTVCERYEALYRVGNKRLPEEVQI